MRLHVGNLSKQMTDAGLNDLAKPFGNLVSAEIATDHATGASKGFAFLEYPSDDEAKAAITGLDGREVDGLALKVSEARPRKTSSQS
jgi:RNA recognition motif-containing protein